ncbi:GntR family transcriptional regulator [Microbacterium sp. TNHR37B]|uniref:GntR family transcriptional regulator n=1 Tax=Microbacterium sp. TNHR37B TaxID=1775956 RepID=UPI0008362F5C|nr:GntR family transcriptional regulator [Microbacterium sp. TNHR37B]
MSEPLPPLDLRNVAILSDEVYETIGAAILDGRLQPGQKLRDVELAAQLGISRTPVREALQRLERFGLVEVAAGRYTRVTEPDRRLREETAELTAHLMGVALRLALAACDDEALAVILADADIVVDAASVGDIPTLFASSTRMFTAVTRATGNSVFIGLVREASLAIRRNLRGWDAFLEGPVEGIDGYTALRACIAARDGDGAEQALRRIYGYA